MSSNYLHSACAWAGDMGAILGTFSTVAANLSSLEYLSLANNELTGALDEAFPVHFPVLQTLDLSSAGIVGGLPSGEDLLQVMQHLTLG